MCWLKVKKEVFLGRRVLYEKLCWEECHQSNEKKLALLFFSVLFATVNCVAHDYISKVEISNNFTETTCIKTEYLASFSKEPQLHWLAFEVIGFIISALLPQMFTEICTMAGVNPDICKAGGDAIGLLLSLQPGNLRIGKAGSIEWKVSKGASQSYISLKSTNLKDAQLLEKLLLAYSENCAKDFVWKKILLVDLNNMKIDYPDGYPVRYINLQNNTGRDLPWSASIDGTKWFKANKGIQENLGPGLLYNPPSFKPVELRFTDPRIFPYYFNDGIYVKFFNGQTEQVSYLLYTKNYELNWVNGRIQAIVSSKK